MPSFTPSSYLTNDIESEISQQASSQNPCGSFNVHRSVGALKSECYSNNPSFSSQHGRVFSQVYSDNKALERQHHGNNPRPQTIYVPSQNNHKPNAIGSQHSTNDAQNSWPQPSDIDKGDKNHSKKMWQCLPIASSEDLEGGKSGCYFWNQKDVGICRNCGEEKAKNGRSWLKALKQMLGCRG